MEKIVILDFGSQYCHLLARRIRDLGVYSEIMAAESKVEEIGDVKGIIISGGPSSVFDPSSPKLDLRIFEMGVPVLGLCFGHQLIAFNLEGRVDKGDVREYGKSVLNIYNSELFKGLGKEEVVWMSHFDTVKGVPEGFKVIGSTTDCPFAAIEDSKKRIYGVQFHPEVTHTKNGLKILGNFVNICGCKKNWSMENFISEKIDEVKDFVGEKKVLLLVSGGVDSTVCFALLNRALGKERVYGLHIDNGLMRKNESSEIKKELEKFGFDNFHVVDASKEFVGALEGVYDPEEKRKIIGEKFIDVQQKELERMGFNSSEWLLGQGTIYPDTIETGGTKNSALIKTHHNRVEVVRQMIKEGKVIEPIKELYKDEVRMLGRNLGLSISLVNRHPFPGPGLGVRCLCGEVEERSDADVDSFVSKYDVRARVLGVKSVGVQGDERTFKNPVVLFGDLNWEELEEISTMITNNFSSVNRVLYSLKFSDGSFKKSFVTKERLDRLREADDIVMKMLIDRGVYDDVWQFPVVMLPVGCNESVVLRPVDSKEAMTAEFSKIDMNIVKEMAEKIYALGFSNVFYDITNKPPGTIEWE